MGGQPWFWNSVEVANGSPEADGSCRHFSFRANLPKRIVLCLLAALFPFARRSKYVSFWGISAEFMHFLTVPSEDWNVGYWGKIDRPKPLA